VIDGFGSSLMNIGVIEGGTVGNVVPGKCMMKVDRRLLPGETIEKAFQEIEEIIVAACPAAKVGLEFNSESYSLFEENSFLSDLRQLPLLSGLKIDIFPAMSEAAIYSKWGDCVIMGPGNLSQAHKPDEYIETNQLEKYTEIFKQIMKNL
jgi:acetylornithine deacetylase/succinyl-diaminopimelate desuccinylase-like protein